MTSGENIRSWFSLADDNKGYFDLSGLRKLMKSANVFVRDSDLEKVFELMDLS